MDTYAADLAALINSLGLHDVVLVGHSTGGGEVVGCAAQFQKQQKAASAIPDISTGHHGLSFTGPYLILLTP